jgi:hypothetical protein
VVVFGFRAERGARGLHAPLSTTPCPSSPLTRGLRETAFGATADKRAEAPQEAPRSGADSADSGSAAASGHSSGDEQDAPPRLPAGLERTLSGSNPVCIPGGDRRRRVTTRAHHAPWVFRQSPAGATAAPNPVAAARAQQPCWRPRPPSPATRRRYALRGEAAQRFSRDM